jgi:hypothetical protein
MTEEILLIGRGIKYLPQRNLDKIANYHFLDKAESDEYLSSKAISIDEILATSNRYDHIYISNLTKKELIDFHQYDWLKKKIKYTFFFDSQIIKNINSKNEELTLEFLLQLFIKPGDILIKLEKKEKNGRIYHIEIQKSTHYYQNLMSKYFYHINHQISALNGKT